MSALQDVIKRSGYDAGEIERVSPHLRATRTPASDSYAANIGSEATVQLAFTQTGATAEHLGSQRDEDGYCTAARRT